MKILVFEQDVLFEDPTINPTLNETYVRNFFEYKDCEMEYIPEYEDEKVVIWSAYEAEEGDSWKFIGIK